jgi:hypothetical protein
MRFAWRREQSPDNNPTRRPFTPVLSLIHKLYNLVFWVFLLPFFTRMTDGTGFMLFSVVIGVRLVLNLYINNLLKPTPQQFEAYPFRIPG